MDKARNRKLMQRLARQMGQAARTAARHKENNPHIDLKRVVKATTERAARRFARRELRPIFLQEELKEETDRLHAEASLRAKGGGCFDIRGNKIPCPLRYRSYEAITSIQRAIFNDFGQFLREESVNSFGMGSLHQSPLFLNQNVAPMMQAYDPNRPVSGPLVHRWKNSKNFLISSTYDIFNDAFQVLQIIDFDIIPSGTNPLTGKQNNINLDGSTNYNSVDGFVNTAAFAIPYARGTKMLSATMPKGLGSINKLNAAQFSKTFKGNLSKLSPKLRGYSNQLMNKLIGTYNRNVPTGMILLKSTNLKEDSDDN